MFDNKMYESFMQKLKNSFFLKKMGIHVFPKNSFWTESCGLEKLLLDSLNSFSPIFQKNYCPQKQCQGIKYIGHYFKFILPPITEKITIEDKWTKV